jgi:NAD(P)-dependent dehydrogenase (short-subunit alcohol dehydrogenase family)
VSGGRLQQRVAIVTGAGCRDGWGNGKAASVLFAREGARLLLVDRDDEALDSTHEAILRDRAERGLPAGEAERWLCDVSDRVQIDAMIARCIERYGRIDVLLNNVGISSGAGLLASSEDDWDRCFAVNVKSVFLAARAAIPQMRLQRGGRIINVSSIASVRTTLPPPHAYAASKAALNMLTRTLAAEFAADGIRCNAILPGMIDTPMVRNSVLAAGASADQALAYDAARHRLSPTGCQGSPWDIAHAALFLASDESAYVNGAELVVDGGLTQLMPMPA